LNGCHQLARLGGQPGLHPETRFRPAGSICVALGSSLKAPSPS
jgi:hypothetical protein